MSRLLALDVGERRIGVAVSDLLGIAAHGAGGIQRKNLEDDINEIKRYINESEAELVVVGMPINMDGSKGESAKKIDDFVKAIEPSIKIPVVTYDERLSTKESERFLISSGVSRKKRKGVIDKVAAQLILESYLNRLKNLSGI